MNRSIQASLLFLLLLLRTASSFQFKYTSNFPTSTQKQRFKSNTVLLFLEPGRYFNEDELEPMEPEPIEPEPTMIATQGVPKPRIPKISIPKFEIDKESIAKKFGAVVATVLFFVIVQKVALLASGIITPELSPEDISNFRL
mmetsp:Transcript_59988/g.70087  ORF Transcript_59988/g.70087 Transcript_59988/m.70087 type:complete len:142 (+) Transcript_59988:127-552(+)|eukprot:CAMPEP_0194377880 /NCGR_PEP_ID=MMETSP0174-20130528/32833_1 /TAXON_ID=216777 /ORGANISM="Proboscia alata, Strain PI-D3" /LENGTH=141 /DNA_ID=CAMNT_0039159525 /DNA_START=80 /DNA_END=505 /DNA_ORIENTATION=+